MLSLDGSLADADAELEQLAAETLRAPARIAGGPLSDKRRTRGRGSTRRPRASAPERATACLVPAEDCRRLDEQRGVAPRRCHACCEPHREALPRCPPDPPRDLSLRDDGCCRSTAFSATRPARRRTTSAASPATNRRTSIIRRVVPRSACGWHL